MKGIATFLAGLWLLAGAPLLMAQTYQGGLRGAVRDQQGGVLPGTTVTLTHEGTNAARTTLTNALGKYMFANL